MRKSETLVGENVANCVTFSQHMKSRRAFRVTDELGALSNNPAGADCLDISVMLQKLLSAAQPERYADKVQ